MCQLILSPILYPSVSANLDEKVHIIIGMVENYCHEIVYHHHKSLNYKVMKEEVIKIISTILRG